MTTPGPQHSGDRLKSGTVPITALKTAEVGLGASKLAKYDADSKLQAADGTLSGDVATFGQMNTAIATAAAASAAGLVNKGVVRAAVTVNVGSLSGAQTLGGVALIAGDDVLLTAQSTGAQGGPWTVAAGAWSRPANWANGSTQKPNSVWTVSEGTEADSFWWVTSDSDIVVGTDAPTIASVPIVGGAGPTGATGPGYGGTSSTSFLIGSGSKVFDTQAGMAYSVGSRVRFSSAANPANYMEGGVTAYSGTSLTALIDATGGSGTLADWNLSLSGLQGAAGTPGAPGSAAGDAFGLLMSFGGF